MDEDFLKVVNSLPTLDSYSAQELYSDFRSVFGTPQGQRVFAQLMAWGRFFRPPPLGNPIDPNKAMISIGETNYARKILAAYVLEPPERPDTQEKK